MESYSDFAYVYDTFMDETPYEEWCDFIVKTLDEYRVPKELVLDLGCGTGVLTRMLSERGYDMIGVDNSWEMLSIAREREGCAEDAPEDGRESEILYLMQDMREFELYGTVRAVISICDSVNYLLEDEDILDCFKLVNNYLDPGGIFLFDFNTVYKYETVIGDTTIAENREDCSFIWENYYHKEEHINEYDLTIFSRDEESDEEVFRKSVETHYQRGYTLDEMKAFVEKAGLEFVKALDADTHEQVSAQSERIYIIAREIQK